MKFSVGFTWENGISHACWCPFSYHLVKGTRAFQLLGWAMGSVSKPHIFIEMLSWCVRLASCWFKEAVVQCQRLKYIHPSSAKAGTPCGLEGCLFQPPQVSSTEEAFQNRLLCREDGICRQPVCQHELSWLRDRLPTDCNTAAQSQGKDFGPQPAPSSNAPMSS